MSVPQRTVQNNKQRQFITSLHSHEFWSSHDAVREPFIFYYVIIEPLVPIISYYNITFFSSRYVVVHILVVIRRTFFSSCYIIDVLFISSYKCISL